MATLIKADGTKREVSPANGKEFSLEEMQGFVGGDIQIVTLPSGDEMVLAEEGKLLGMPVNTEATLMARPAGIAPNDLVVGDVLVCTFTEAGG